MEGEKMIPKSYTFNKPSANFKSEIPKGVLELKKDKECVTIKWLEKWCKENNYVAVTEDDCAELVSNACDSMSGFEDLGDPTEPKKVVTVNDLLNAVRLKVKVELEN